MKDHLGYGPAKWNDAIRAAALAVDQPHVDLGTYGDGERVFYESSTRSFYALRKGSKVLIARENGPRTG